MIQALLLDAGGVLVLPDDRRVAVALATAGVKVDPKGLSGAHYAAMAAYDRAGQDDDSRAAAYRAAYLVAAWIPPAQRPRALEAFERLAAGPGYWTWPAPGARATLAAVAARSLSIVVVSNTERGDAARQLAAAGVCQVGPGPAVPVTASSTRRSSGFASPTPRSSSSLSRPAGKPGTATSDARQTSSWSSAGPHRGARPPDGEHGLSLRRPVSVGGGRAPRSFRGAFEPKRDTQR